MFRINLAAKVRPEPPPQSRFSVHLARHADEVRAAQKLRWEVFAGEQGARLDTPFDGFDIDRFDAECDHLIVRDHASSRVVGTYRLLPGAAARRLGGFYSEQEFDFDALLIARLRTLEMGRSCVHPDYRSGAVIALLWSGLANYVAGTRFTTLIGCASIPLGDASHDAASIYARLRRDHLSPRHLRVTPRIPFKAAPVAAGGKAAAPPLIKGYLRAGAVLCGPPSHDADFNTADLFMMLDLRRLAPRHARHFLGVTGRAA